METVNSFKVLGVIAILLVLVPFLRAKNNYRRYVACAEELTSSHFEIRSYAGGEVLYFLGRKRLSFLEVCFAKRDISSLAKKGVELKKQYCSALGKVIEEDDAFKVLLSNYKIQLLKWCTRFSLTPYKDPLSRPRAPYSYLRESYASTSVTLPADETETYQMVL